MAQVTDIAWDIGLMLYGLALLMAAVGMVFTLVEGATGYIEEDDTEEEEVDSDSDSDSVDEDLDADMDYLVRERVAGMRALQVEAVGPPH